MELAELRKLVRQGEGFQLEFKRKAKYPEKIAREFVAFANSEGGILLLGVDDDGSIYGSKSPGEDQFILEDFLQKYLVPKIDYKIRRIPITAQREVILFQVKSSYRKPHFIRYPDRQSEKQAYVRVKDMSVKASKEMVKVLRHNKDKQGVSLRIGEAEKRILAYLEEHAGINLQTTSELLKSNLQQASSKLVILTRAGILSIKASEKGDVFSLNKKAFE
ncbi:MAG: ATP-binding protein [Bacteroidia bacterium]|nr:ATP-binding protein [Bacteroidia bacterium]